MSLRRTVTDAALWGLAQKWGYHGIRLLVFVVLARLLTPGSFGVVALASVFILLGEMLVDQGFSDALVQRRRVGPAHLDCAFWASLGMGIVLTAACFLAAGPLAAAFGQPRLEGVLRWLSPVLLLASLARVQEALLRRELAFKRIATIRLAAISVGGATGLWMAVLGFGVWSLVGQLLAQRVVELPCLWWATAWRPRARFSTRHFRELLRFGANVTGINLLNFVNRQADHLLIGYFLGATALGYYTVGYRLIRILLDLLPHALMPVAFSTFSRLQASPQRMREGFYEATRVMALAAFPAFCGMALLAPMLVPTVFGERWAPSAAVVQVLAPIGLLQSVSLLYPTALKAAGRPGWVLVLAGINAVANIAAFSVAVQWGIVAVAAAYTVRGYVLWPLTWWALQRVLRPRPARYVRALWPALAGTAVMAATLLLLDAWLPPQDRPYLVLTASVLLGAVSYALAVRVAAPAQCREIWQSISQHIHAHGARS